jgi:hypothetical protein
MVLFVSTFGIAIMMKDEAIVVVLVQRYRFRKKIKMIEV